VEKDYLVLKLASGSRPSGKRSDDDYDVLADGVVIGRIFKVRLGGRTPWMWTLAFGHHEDRTPTHGYEPTREGRDGSVREELAARVKGVDGLAALLDSEQFRSAPRTCGRFPRAPDASDRPHPVVPRWYDRRRRRSGRVLPCPA
jgi:hypothetical protein